MLTCHLRHLTFTNQQLVIVDEADGALTPEAADHVDAHSILTHTRDFPALIDIYHMKRQNKISNKTFLIFVS